MQHDTASSQREQPYDFANILFAGPCNQRCPYCIGRQVDPGVNRPNLDRFPPRNLERFAALLRRHDVRQIVLTGTNTDPQLYQHEERLINWLRENVPRGALSLHTNGQRVMNKIALLNRYNRATISFPSFDPHTFFRMTGVRRMPDLPAILAAARIPVKVSSVITAENAAQVDAFLARCHAIGVRRVVLRQAYGGTSPPNPLADRSPVSFYRHNPVYDWDGMQVTWWNFGRTTSTSLNLFADGTISTRYLLRGLPRA